MASPGHEGSAAGGGKVRLRAERGRVGQDRAGQGKTGHGRAGRGRTGQGRSEEEWRGERGR